MNFRTILLLLLSLGLGQNGFAQKKRNKKQSYHYLDNTLTTEELKAETNKENRIFYTLQGHFSNAEQADTTSNPLFKNSQECISFPIWQDRIGERWYYTRWIPAGQPERPLVEVIGRFKRINRDTFEISFMGLPKGYDPREKVEEWLKENPFGQYSPKDLEQELTCTVIVTEPETNYIRIDYDQLCDAKDVAGGHIAYTAMSGDYYADYYKSYAAFFGPDKTPIFAYERPVGLLMKRLDKTQANYRPKR